MKFRLPIIIPTGLKPVVTQPYGATADLSFYKENGVNIPFHNGVDIVTSGTTTDTYGCPVMTPSDGWTIVKVFDSGNPISNNGNEVVIHSPIFTDDDGTQKVIELRFVHLSNVQPILEGRKVENGTIFGNIGNSGLVFPTPTPQEPYNGTHLHLGMVEFEYKNGQLINNNVSNGVYGLLDPLTRIDITNFETGNKNIIDNSPALNWAFDTLGIKETWQKIIFAFTNWWNGR